MTTQDFDPKGLEAARKNLIEAMNSDFGFTDERLVLAVLAAYFGAIEPEQTFGFTREDVAALRDVGRLWYSTASYVPLKDGERSWWDDLADRIEALSHPTDPEPPYPGPIEETNDGR